MDSEAAEIIKVRKNSSGDILTKSMKTIANEISCWKKWD